MIYLRPHLLASRTGWPSWTTSSFANPSQRCAPASRQFRSFSAHLKSAPQVQSSASPVSTGQSVWCVVITAFSPLASRLARRVSGRTPGEKVISVDVLGRLSGRSKRDVPARRPRPCRRRRSNPLPQSSTSPGRPHPTPAKSGSAHYLSYYDKSQFTMRRTHCKTKRREDGGRHLRTSICAALRAERLVHLQTLRPGRQGRLSRPRTLVSTRRVARSGKTSNWGSRASSSSKATRISRRARWMPRQRWIP